MTQYYRASLSAALCLLKEVPPARLALALLAGPVSALLARFISVPLKVEGAATPSTLALPD